MRVTNRMISTNAVGHMTESLSQFNDSMETNATGKQFKFASDNPANAAESLDLRSTIAKNDAYINTAKSTNLWMQATTSGIEDMIELGMNASNLTMQALSDTMGEDQRGAIAQEIDMILTQAVGVGNTKHLGHYIFGGFQTNTVPFTLDANLTPPPTQVVTYHGDVGDIKRNIGPDTAIKVNANGTIFNATGTNIFASLINIRDALQATTFNRADVEAGLAELNDAVDSINDQDTYVAGRQKELQDAITRMETTKIALKSLLSQKEDVNGAEAVADMKQKELIYQKVLNVGNRAISTMSLFDYLQ